MVPLEVKSKRHAFICCPPPTLIPSLVPTLKRKEKRKLDYQGAKVENNDKCNDQNEEVSYETVL